MRRRAMRHFAPPSRPHRAFLCRLGCQRARVRAVRHKTARCARAVGADVRAADIIVRSPSNLKGRVERVRSDSDKLPLACRGLFSAFPLCFGEPLNIP
eukprot:IDg21388t1